MRLIAPRIPPVADHELTPDQKQVLELLVKTGQAANIFRTLVHAPKAARAFIHWTSYVLSRRNDLSAREREIVILRTGFLCQSGYEWAHHVRFALESGLSGDEIARIKIGADAQGWSESDKVLLQASDELHHDQFISEPTWVRLTSLFTEKECMDVVFTAAQYTQVSMILNSFGVQLDEGLVLDRDLMRY